MKTLAPLLVIIAGICWGFIGVISRELTQAGYNAVQVAATRCMITSLVLVVLILLTDPRKLCISLKHLWYFIGTGIFSVTFFYICYFITIEMTTLSIAAILLYTSPFIVVILSSIIFKEKITTQKTISLFLAFGGCILSVGIIGTSTTALSPIGLLFGLGAGFGYALYTIFGRLALKRYHPFTVTVYTFLIAGTTLTPFSNVGQMFSIAFQEPKVILFALIIGLICTFIPYLLYTKSLETLEAGTASIMAFTEAMVATICGITIFKENITSQNLSGIILIFVSLVLLNIDFSKKRFSKIKNSKP